MKKLLLLVLLLMLVDQHSFAQQKLSELLLICQGKDLAHGLEAVTNKGGNWRLTKDSVMSVINEDPKFRKFSETLSTFFDNRNYLPLRLGGKNFLTEYQNESGKTGIAFLGIAVGKTYNNLKLDAKQRAAQVIDDFVLDLLKEAYASVENSNYQSIIVHASYLNNNFATNKDYDVQSEGLVLSADIQTIKQFVDNKISDKELIKKASIYLLANDSKSYKKIEL